MNVLSLFDGISCGQVALEKAKIKYSNYFASEIDKYAIKVTMNNYKNTIQLGDVCNIKAKNLPKIDLLIGGSPCQGFSFAGKRLNFNDSRSKLFFEYVRLLNECRPKYFLLENVVMPIKEEGIISHYLNILPVKINSALVSAQNRNRLYWTNIQRKTNPKIKSFFYEISNISQPKNKKIFLKDILQTTIKNKLTNSKLDYLKQLSYKRFGTHLGIVQQLKHHCLVAMGKSDVLILTDLKRYITPIECERLQTLPDNYTQIISDSQRYRCLGNCWTVDIIAHIFQGLMKWN